MSMAEHIKILIFKTKFFFYLRSSDRFYKHFIIISIILRIWMIKK